MTDAHVHLFPETVARERNVFFDDTGFSLLYSNSKSRLATTQTLHKYAQKFSLSSIWALGFSWQNRDRCALHNRALIEAKSSIVIPFACVPSTPISDIDSWCEQIASDGFAGIGELSFYQEGLCSANISYLSALLASCARFGLIVILHVNEPVGHTYPGKYYSDFGLLYQVILNNPETKIVLSHFGGGIFVYESMPEVRSCFRNVFYDTAAAPYIFDASVYRMFKAAGLKNKLLFGTDYPLMDPDRYLPVFQQADLSIEELSQLTEQNATRLLDNNPL